MHDEFFALLHKDHVAVQGLLNHLSVAPASDREEPFRKLKMELLPHLEDEEAGFLPGPGAAVCCPGARLGGPR